MKILNQSGPSIDPYRTLKIKATAWKCSIKKVFLDISQNSQGNTCVGFFFSIKS